MKDRIRALSEDVFRQRLEGDGLGVAIGPFDTRIRATVRGLAAPLYRLYRDYPLLEGERVFSIHASLTERRQWLPRPGRLVRFSVDGRVPHQDLPAEQALAVLEWGLNLVIALRYHSFLMLHSAVVARDGRALLLPAWPGHGKTTLCAALAHRGWRLLSDEFGLVRPGSMSLVPIPRPMPLKNESIEIVRAFAPEAELGPVIPNTRKGTVVHVKPPTASIADAVEDAQATWIIFPRWLSGASLAVETVRPVEAFMMLATNAFNYELLGERAFETVRGLINGTRSYRLVYSDLEEVVSAIDTLTKRHAP